MLSRKPRGGDGSGIFSEGKTNGNETGNLLNLAPMLLPLANYGGATSTHALLPGSPAVDAGSCADAFNGGAVAVDQRSVVRPLMQGCDIGAYEALPFLFLPLIRR